MTDASDATDPSADTTAHDFLTATRRFYDAIAEDYAGQFREDLAARPLERALLTAYAETVLGEGAPAGDGQVADLGCGPGVTTAFLASLGVPVLGVDLSASMIAVARREHPGLRFEQGSMLDLDLPDGRLAGVVSWYSSIHTPVDRLPALFSEFARVLAPGGHLLLAFQAGDAPRRITEPYGHPVSLDFQRRRPERIAGLLEEAGLRTLSHTVREAQRRPYEETSPHAFLIARKPGPADTDSPRPA
ncbi:class I SAM-dependent methyltransferase [Streptomyces sp. NPDC006610]|uniref:class I SAM-dependent DNA methyltransferase n=1 Tax=Streptomyces sp. NPDC006610 TaxID=3154584 RepID=UPI0033A479C6